jgi:RimJ/RimL family protein N-acetyltransferase
MLPDSKPSTPPCYAGAVSNLTLSQWKPPQRPIAAPLSGRYVLLDPLDAPRHGPDLWDAVQDHDDLWAWLAGGPYPDANAMLDHLEKWREAERAVLLAIIPKDTAKASGWASFMRIKPAHGVIEVGNVLFSPALQCTRAATEAMYLMARHVFDDLGYRRYEWKCNAQNEASRRAALRFGFTFEGIFRQHMVVKGRSRDTAWFAMLDHEWPARKRAFEAWLDPANFDQTGRQRSTLTQIATALS